MRFATPFRALGRAIRGVAADVRRGALFGQQPHHVDFCTCCGGDHRLQRCDQLLRQDRLERTTR